mmetsp:Transcript_23501/g.83877  ORF Transcript_23501/g.83877 Transcript_23501/m.83877 type:complete len:199 (-) Transcript_23501:92-688(-)
MGAYYRVSDRVGKAADAIVDAVAALQRVPSLAQDATKYFGTAEGATNPLHGGWQNLWTTAADATFDANSTRGDADICNIVDAKQGTITNVITFKGPPKPVQQLRVRIKAVPTSKRQLNLIFSSVQVRFTKRFLWIFKTIKIPVPAVALSRIIFFFKRKKAPPLPFFEVVYLDGDLRVQQTGEGNLFIQQRIDEAVVAV